MFRCCALALLPWLCLPAADMPSPGGLISCALELDKKLTAVQAQYTYTEEVRNSQVSKDGKVGTASVKTFDVVSLEGEPYRKLISLNGKPLSTSQQRKVDEDFQKTQAERRAARHSPFHVERKAYIGGLPDLIEYFDNRVTGAETVRGRPTWVMESGPKSGVSPTGKQQAEILSWRHKSWFDQEDGTRVQWQDTVVQPVNGFQPGSEMLFEMDRGPQGPWLRSKTTSHLEVNFNRFMNARVLTVQTFTNYKKFEVNSTLTAPN